MEAAAIWLENVSFGYPGRQVLQEINFTVKKGEHIGIVGKSGCGKSTLLKLIAGLYRMAYEPAGGAGYLCGGTGHGRFRGTGPADCHGQSDCQGRAGFSS